MNPLPVPPMMPPPAPVIKARLTEAEMQSLRQSTIAGHEEPDHRIPLPVGTEVGAYIITGSLGQGGFGITYRAKHRLNGMGVVIKEHMPRGLALRESDGLGVVCATPGSEAVYQATLQEFTEEVTVLMGLQHPGIVPILDAMEANGTAYYVMPFVAGAPLELSPRATLNRDRQAQEARRLKRQLMLLLDTLIYMEQHNVVHRDIKPENIRITPEGQPILLDFGSARQIQPDKVYTNIYTPGFCAPEQASCTVDSELTRKLGPWTDIYSLGATFHYLMTRMLPPRAEMRLNSATDPYHPLAARSGLVALYGRVFLEAIDRAMALSPRERWQDASAWRASVEENAMPGTPKQLRRARMLVAGSSLALAVLAGISLWALHERDQAQQLYGSSLRFTESILYDFNEELSDIPGSTSLQQQLGTRLKAYLDEMERTPVAPGDDKLPRAMATAWYNLASVYMEQGKLEDSTAALRRATKLVEQLLDDEPNNPRNAYELARILLMRADVAEHRNLTQDASLLAARALDLLRPICKAHPDNPDYSCMLGRALSATGTNAIAEGDADRRQAALSEMLTLYRDLANRYPEHEGTLIGLADCLHQLGAFVLLQEKFEEAEAYFKEEGDIYAKLVDAQPYRLSFLQGQATAQLDMGDLYNDRSLSKDPVTGNAEDDTKAIEAYSNHVELAQALKKLDSHNTSYDSMECRARSYMIDALLRTGRPAQALAQCKLLMPKIDELLTNSPDDVKLSILKAGALRGMARVHNNDEQTRDQAVEEIDAYRALVSKLLEKTPDNIILQFLNLDALTESATIALSRADVLSSINFIAAAERQLSKLSKNKSNPIIRRRLAAYEAKLRNMSEQE